MSYSTDKCLERVHKVESEDLLKSTDCLFEYHTKDGTQLGVGKDIKGNCVVSKDEKSILKCYVEGDNFAFYKNGKKYNTVPIDHTLGLLKCLDKLYRVEKQSNEDGTIADLGPAPTGHKKDCDMHSLCAHEIDEDHNFDDGW